ncbi:endolytic transglycosylase MltG [Candidatus Saccharibacteria bacterium]|nr:endolytic transglycosylase MltG [Candidatus Saccharibacteria bacterium]
MKLIALDVGEKRIGVAKADTSVLIAVPVGTFNVDGTEFDQISRLSRVYGSTFFVIGLPRNSKGEETAQSAYSRNFAKQLKEKIPGAKVTFEDESLTSVMAEDRLKNRPHKKGDIDAEAATIILQTFLERLAKKTGTKIDNPENKKHIGKFFVALISILLVLGVAASGAFLWYNSSLSPVDTSCGDACSKVEFSVKDGESTADIATNLESAKLVKSALSFRILTHLKFSGETYKSGTYYFSTNQSPEDIAKAMVEGADATNVFWFTLLPGGTIMDAKKAFKSAGYSDEAIEKGFSADFSGRMTTEGKPENSSLEGYLYGETYQFYSGESVENILSSYLDGLAIVVAKNNLKEKYAEHGLSLYEGIVLASIVQKEAHSADMPTVASVFLNRLKYGIPLGSDVTVKYALDLVDPNREVYNNNADALAIDSCYNTRRNTGLPCGPISSPGLSALLAVASPADTDYLYFLTGDDGAMYYAHTEAEHEANIRDHCQVACAAAL